MKVIETSWRRAESDAPAAALPVRSHGIASVTFAGYAIIAALILGFALWSWLAPLASAVNAAGQIIVDGQHKTIQHLESGIIRDILVRDGDKVTAGQVLVRLDDAQARANLKLSSDHYHAAEALVARLAAEQSETPQITFPADLLDAAHSDPDVAHMVAGQAATFDAQRKEMASQTEILNQRNAQADAEISGLRAQITAQERQLSLLAEELDGLNYLLAKGLVPKPQVLEKQRMQADISGQRAQNRAAIARAQQAIGETKMRILDLRTTLINDAAGKLGDAQKDMYEAQQRATAAQDVMNRMVIVAPEDGIIVAQKVHTPGGVIEAGQTLMDIVPVDQRAVADVKVEVNDITKVHEGLPAELRLVGYEQRTTPTVPATVIWVSADRIDDDKQHTSYYDAHIAADPVALAGLPNVTLRVGMPVEASIATGERTLLEYVLAPLSRVLAKGMREQ